MDDNSTGAFDLDFFANRRGVGSGIASVCCEKGTVVENVIREYGIDDHN